jgi:hypothetical protein
MRGHRRRRGKHRFSGASAKSASMFRLCRCKRLIPQACRGKGSLRCDRWRISTCTAPSQMVVLSSFMRAKTSRRRRHRPADCGHRPSAGSTVASLPSLRSSRYRHTRRGRPTYARRRTCRGGARYAIPAFAAGLLAATSRSTRTCLRCALIRSRPFGSTALRLDSDLGRV